MTKAMTEAGASTTDALRFGGVTPIFRVGNLAASLEYYVKVLGFTIDWELPGVVAGVSRDHVAFFLSEGDQGHPGSWAWIGVGDVERLHEDLKRRGAKVRQPPTNFSWALEMQVEDLDGNVLRIGSEPIEDRPFGPWLDMYGRSWAPSPDGSGWQRVE
jgi:catechol 2,3-dioxygenase-like lactoylglutathione lyase family enzyme